MDCLLTAVNAVGDVIAGETADEEKHKARDVGHH
jgi:hypothetical protein